MTAKRTGYSPSWVAWVLVVVGALGVIVIVAVLLDGRMRSAVPEPIAPRVKAPASATVSSVADVESVADATAPCTQQQLTLTQNERSLVVCVGETDTEQNGSVRSYQVATSSHPTQWLRIEVTGNTVLSAALGTGAAHEYRCRGDGCVGIVVGRHDSRGVRVISLDHTSLIRAPADAMQSSATTTIVTGELRTVPEDQLAGLACTGEGVSVTTSDSSAIPFCPMGGAGFEIGDDGKKTYRFTSLDGGTILVTAENDRVQQVTYEGEATLACVRPACDGVQISTPDGDGVRTFTFAGTTLIEASGNSNAVLNGTLLLPAL